MTTIDTKRLIARARDAAKRADWYMTGESPLFRALADSLEAAEQERDEARKAAEDHVLDADAVHVRLSAELREVSRERDNWKLSAEEATRAEKRWKDRAVEAERERDRLDEAFDRDLPWRYDEVEAQRNQLAAVVEKVRAADSASSSWDHFGHLVMDILATAPDDALREHDAALIEGLADEVHATLSDPNRKRPRDPRGEFATDLLNDVAWAVHLIREKARQQREGQS